MTGRGKGDEEGHSVGEEGLEGGETSDPALVSSAAMPRKGFRSTFLMPLIVRTTSSLSAENAIGAARYPSSTSQRSSIALGSYVRLR